MAQKHRLFVALDLPEQITEHLAALRDPDLKVRWVGGTQHHLTLVFIGYANDAQMDSVREALGTVRGSRLSLEISGVDAFPSARRARVLVAPVLPNEKLMRLQHDVVAALAGVGVEPEERPYRPHVTLARLKDPQPEAVRAYLDRHADLYFGPIEVDAFYLYESTLRPSGAEYERRATFAVNS
ncbi:MAG TPA: RNA 2',3'-cyclic phosphodiesterase [Rhodothermales bacterium]|nr:RNA 2',3'-cyclic phosphodiesterase [Rhodothermales bacterium]